MAIVSVCAIPYNLARDWLDPDPADPAQTYAHSFSEVWAISAIEPDPECHMLYRGEAWKERAITLRFHDVTPCEGGNEGLVLFDEAMAWSVVNHVVRAHQKSQPNACMVVNCMAGISRSGAIATFVAEACGIARNDLYATSPQIYPNLFVLQLLRQEWKRRAPVD